MTTSDQTEARCFAGLPQWQHPAWEDSLHCISNHAHPLARYASYFNSVEGNTTFYGLPGHKSLKHWDQMVTESFRFCFKFPQTISHQAELRHCDKELASFIEAMTLLQGKIGLLCLQLPASFSIRQLDILAAFLKKLPADFHYGIEVRNPDFFRKDDAERSFNRLLIDHQINRISFDTRALFALPQQDPVSLDAQAKKPQLPVHVIATGQRPMLRFITPLEWEAGLPWLQPWIKKTAAWLDEGRSPFLFFHTPDNNQSPLLAEYFARQLNKIRPGSLSLPEWPQPNLNQESLF